MAAVVPHWLEIWYELEALSSLANAAYLDPALIFPTVRGDETAPVFVVEGLGHPLLAPEQKVRNNFAFHQLGDLAILTGSNMAGKSTFLKALGVNLALANAGGVVDTRRFDTTLFRLFTCIKVSDSVTDGISYFYAEVRRLKALLTALEEQNTLPLFFCIDEIFRGTNNRERLLGSRAYIRALVHGHGVGLIATHDLELVKLADEAPQIANFHFRDDLADGQMVFDYHLRPGPSPTTNALKLMHSAGLPVTEGEGAES
jgi:DNA mismatch repair ATPase MutS